MSFINKINKLSSMKNILIFLSILIFLFSIVTTEYRVSILSFITLVFILTSQLFYQKFKIKIPEMIYFLIITFNLLSLIFSILRFHLAFLSNYWRIISPIIFSIIISLLSILIVQYLFAKNNLNSKTGLLVFFSFTLSYTFFILWEIIAFFLNMLKIDISLSGEIIEDLSAQAIITNFLFALAGISLISIYYYYSLGHKKLNFINRTLREFKKKNPFYFNKSENIKNIILEGEGNEVEFKSTLRYNLHTKQNDKKIERVIVKTINAFLNTHGGTLLVGVDDDGKILGLRNDRFKNDDAMMLHFINLIKKDIGTQYIKLINSKIVDVEGDDSKIEKVLMITCVKSKQPIFLRKDNNEDEFYVRSGPASSPLLGSKLIDYVKSNF